MEKEPKLFGPFGYTQSPRLCPECRSRLVVMGGWGLRIGHGLMGKLGIVCHCVQCNTKYRAAGTVSLRRLQMMIVAATSLAAGLFGLLLTTVLHLSLAVLWGAVMMGVVFGVSIHRSLSQWLWWACADLQHVTTWTQDSSFLEKE